MYKIQTQKTYLGRTAGGWLRKAEVSEMSGGDYAVTTPELPGRVLTITMGGDMVICDMYGTNYKLETSDTAFLKLTRMEIEANNLTLESVS